MKKYLFLLVTAVMAAGFLTLSFLTQETARVVYAPMETIAPTATPREEKRLHRTKMVYCLWDEKYFHLRADCGNRTRPTGIPCGTALDEGKLPCTFCMNGYVTESLFEGNGY